MAGEKQMVPGFNHNVKHKGTPYHVQTEDSGIDNPRIITHLFVGGNIIASKKTSYADIVGAENLAQVVRELMEEQHKEMLRNLVAGVYENTEEEIAAKARAFQPGQIVAAPERAATARAPEPERTAPPRVPQPERATPGHPEPERAAAPRPPDPEHTATPRPPEASKANPAKPPPIPRQVSQNPKQDLTAMPPPVPPTPSVPERRPERTAVAAAPALPAARPAPRSAPAQRPAAPANPQAGCPATAQRRGAEALFGEDLISEKSLDEVILSYLAEDLAGKG